MTLSTGGLEMFQPKDARGVDKTTGEVTIHDQSGSESEEEDDKPVYKRSPSPPKSRSPSPPPSPPSRRSSVSSVASDASSYAISGSDDTPRGIVKAKPITVPQTEKPEVYRTLQHWYTYNIPNFWNLRSSNHSLFLTFRLITYLLEPLNYFLLCLSYLWWPLYKGLFWMTSITVCYEFEQKIA